MRALRKRLSLIRNRMEYANKKVIGSLKRRHRILHRSLRRCVARDRKEASLRAWNDLETKVGLSEAQYWQRLKHLAGKGRSDNRLPEQMKDDLGRLCGGLDAEAVWTQGWAKLGVENMADTRYDAAFAQDVATYVASLEKKEGPAAN